MSLTPYRRGKSWWAKGRIEFQGKPLSDYYRKTTGSTEEAGAWAWCREEEERVLRRHLITKFEP